MLLLARLGTLIREEVLRDEVHDWEGNMDDFRVRFSQDAILVVPGGSFKEETVQVAAILW